MLTMLDHQLAMTNLRCLNPKKTPTPTLPNDDMESFPNSEARVALTIIKLRPLQMNLAWKYTLDSWTDEDLLALIHEFTPISDLRVVDKASTKLEKTLVVVRSRPRDELLRIAEQHIRRANNYNATKQAKHQAEPKVWAVERNTTNGWRPITSNNNAKLVFTYQSRVAKDANDEPEEEPPAKTHDAIEVYLEHKDTDSSSLL
ncbi:hypothetical protein TCE0_060f18775 [Talaromyces pinophilus]|uniref:Uncharacterized protein n=1 Tax=Talaromyces pinophilus TaxID=128442 RepID=A0A6V8HNY1_TALPI|nr:hypothetical protein TCE0_060f18775 [Talaromyces pinophilus]